MKTYKIVYWINGNKLVKKQKADNMRQAEMLFYVSTACDDIISIEEVTENV